MTINLSRAIGLFALITPVAALILAGLPGSTSAEEYEYDAAGRLSRVTYDTGQVVDYFYDNNSRITSIVTTSQTSVEPDPPGRILENSLGPSQPNPASRGTRLRFSLAEDGEVTLRFFDVAGRLVHAIEMEYAAGEYEVQVNVSRWPAGVYFYRLEVSGFTATRRLVVLN
jgi:YD repeat-containing protein